MHKGVMAAGPRDGPQGFPSESLADVELPGKAASVTSPSPVLIDHLVKSGTAVPGGCWSPLINQDKLDFRCPQT